MWGGHKKTCDRKINGQLTGNEKTCWAKPGPGKRLMFLSWGVVAKLRKPKKKPKKSKKKKKRREIGMLGTEVRGGRDTPPNLNSELGGIKEKGDSQRKRKNTPSETITGGVPSCKE